MLAQMSKLAPMTRSCRSRARRAIAPREPVKAFQMAESDTYYITTAISYPNGRPAYRPCLRADRDRRDRALQAARRQGRVLPDRHRRARPEDAADGDARRHHRRATWPIAIRDVFRAMAALLERLQRRFHPHDRSAALPRLQAIWKRMVGGRRHLPRQLCRLVFGARRGLLRREGADVGARTASATRRSGTPVEWVEEESYFFRLSAYQDRLLALYESSRTSSVRRSAATRSSASSSPA